MRCILYALILFAVVSCAPLKFAQKHEPFYVKSHLPKYKNINVALVLGAGGAKGLAHVGVIEELEKAGIKIDLIVGCSAGALVGSLYADSKDINYVKSSFLNAKREQFFKLSSSHLPMGLSNGNALKSFLHEKISAQDFEELKIPFVSVATDLQYGNLVAFLQGEIEPAVRASAAYPGAYLPVNINDQLFVDGAVANPLPVEIAKQLGAKFIIAVDISELLTDNPPTNLFGIVKRSLEISYIHKNRISGALADYVITMPFKEIGTFNDSLNQQIYEMGQESGRKAAIQIKSMLKSK